MTEVWKKKSLHHTLCSAGFDDLCLRLLKPFWGFSVWESACWAPAVVCLFDTWNTFEWAFESEDREMGETLSFCSALNYV